LDDIPQKAQQRHLDSIWETAVAELNFDGKDNKGRLTVKRGVWLPIIFDSNFDQNARYEWNLNRK
jgi:hypothetical protein